MNLPPPGTADIDAPMLADQPSHALVTWRTWCLLLSAFLAVPVTLTAFTVNEPRDSSTPLTSPTPAAVSPSECAAAGVSNHPKPPTSPVGLDSSSPAAVGARTH